MNNFRKMLKISSYSIGLSVMLVCASMGMDKNNTGSALNNEPVNGKSKVEEVNDKEMPEKSKVNDESESKKPDNSCEKQDILKEFNQEFITSNLFERISKEQMEIKKNNQAFSSSDKELEEDPERGPSKKRMKVEIVPVDGVFKRHDISRHVEDGLYYFDSEFVELYNKLVLEENKSQVYAERYVELLSEGFPEELVKKAARVYEKEIEAGREFDYAEYYSRLIAKGEPAQKAKIKALIFNLAMNRTSSYDYSEYYTKLILSGKSETYSDLRSKEYEKCVSDNKETDYSSYYSELIARGEPSDIADKKASTYSLCMSRGNSTTYAIYYANLIANGEEKEKAEYQAGIYEIFINQGLKNIYANLYAKLMADGVEYDWAEKYVKMYMKCRKDCRDYNYFLHSFNLMSQGRNEIELDKEVIEELKKERAEQILNISSKCKDKAEEYSNYYAELVVDGKTEAEAKKLTEVYEKISKEKGKTYAVAYVNSLSKGKSVKDSEKCAEVYEMCLKMGKTPEYSLYYSQEVVKPKSNVRIKEIEKEASIYEECINSYRSDIYAEHYAKLIGSGESHEHASKISEIYEECIRNNKSKAYADYYSNALINDDANEYIEIRSDMYDEYIRNGRSRIFSLYCANLYTLDSDVDLMEKGANMYERCINEGKSHKYADYCATLAMDRWMSEENIRMYADTYMKFLDKGLKPNCASDLTDLHMKLQGSFKESSLSKIEDIYLKNVEKGMSPYYIKYFCEKYFIKGLTEGYTKLDIQKQAKDYEYYFNKCLLTGKNYSFSDLYARFALKGKNEEELYRRLSIYEQCITKGKSSVYSACYSRLILCNCDEDFADDMALLSERYVMQQGKSKKYAFFCIELLRFGFELKAVETMAETCERLFESGETNEYVICYAKLVLLGKNHDEAQRCARKFEKILKKEGQERANEYYNLACRI